MTPSKNQRGVAAVEFGILIIPMLLMLMGLMGYGRAIYQYNTLAKSVRDATRYLTLVAPGNGWPDARCLAVTGKVRDADGCTGNVLVPGLTEAMVSICDATNCPKTHAVVETGPGGGTLNLVTVEIRDFQFNPLIPSFTIGGLTIGVPAMTFDPIGNTMRQAL